MGRKVWMVRLGEFVLGCWGTLDAAIAHVSRLQGRGLAPYYSEHLIDSEAPVELKVGAAVPASPPDSESQEKP